MNNKFIKRVAAVVLGVAVMSSCAFAATVVEDNTEYVNQTKTLSFKIDNASGADKISYIAYAGPTEAEAKTIVAVNQIDDADANVVGTVPISESLLAAADAKVIVFQSGDSEGNDVTSETLSVDDYVASATLEATEVEAGDFLYTNVPKFNVSVEIKKGNYSFNGITIKGIKDGKEDTKDVPAPSIEGTGKTWVYNIYVIGAEDAASMTATANVTPVVE